MFDIIGDVHGQAVKLQHLLLKLGYQNTDQGYSHSEYKAIFVGDFIDRGPFQLETLQIVKDMVDNQNAYAIMGNHEFNAIGWVTPNPKKIGDYYRTHNDTHYKQHKIFLSQLDEGSEQHLHWINWFKALPLFLDLADIRVIHACWDNAIINNIAPYLNQDNSLQESVIQSAFDKSHPLFDYCEILLKGKEVKLPKGTSYFDKDGHKRYRSRIKWWVSEADTLNELCLIPDEEFIPSLNQSIHFRHQAYQDTKPVFFGHYWFSGNPSILTSKLACVDYSAAIDSGKLVTYRWQGENMLTNQHLVY